MELIHIQQATIGDGAVNAVNARELHAKLEIKSRFNDWIANRLFDFIENEDYIVVTKSLVTEGRDVILTVDTAKHIAMIERSEIGKRIRQYFIDVEKQNKPQFQIPKTYSEALMLAAKQAEQIEQQNALIEQQKPKVEFYEAVTGSSDTIDIGQAAKVLNIKGIGRNNLFEFLREQEIINSSNIPFQKYVDRGYFRLIETKYTKPDGSTHINLKTVVYQKGLDYIRKLLEGGQNEYFA